MCNLFDNPIVCLVTVHTKLNSLFLAQRDKQDYMQHMAHYFIFCSKYWYHILRVGKHTWYCEA